MLAKTFLFSLLLTSSSFVLGVEASSYDIVVYGGTSGGVTAGIQAARMGKTVVIIEPTKFLGGLTTGGLGATDIGNKAAIGGISREFYQRIFKHYSDPTQWKTQTREAYFAKKQHGGGAGSEDTMWTFEPHVATKVYDEMIAEAKVPVVYGERLDLQKGVVKEGAQITEIIMESGKRFRAKMFIDATYEGDLMAKAGVSYRVGREANAEFNETINGIQTSHAKSHQFIKNVDPYIKPGDPKSGVLPAIQTDGSGVEFAGDKRIQAYNYRMCTTDVPENRLEWPKPKNYDPLLFELALRNAEAGDVRIQWNPVWMPNNKTDTNNNFAISSDFIGMNYDYPDADYATRDRIIQAHKDYQLGLIWTMANSERVPEKVRAAYQKLGLAKDEFLDNENWPRQLYVREARRMASEYIMTEHNCLRHTTAEDSVGMGAYNMDSHNCQRYITKEGFVRNEGDIQTPTRPYPISFQALRPKAEECTNLLVPVCLSATHIAYGSIRMEPVFMVLGQSSATAAVQAIDEKVIIQKIDYQKLKATLLKDNQVLELVLPPATAKVGHQGIELNKLEGIVVDDQEAELTGFETHSSATAPYVNAGYCTDGNEDKGQQKAIFKTNIKEAGTYEVRIAYPGLPNRASNVPVTVTSADGSKTIMVNQKVKAPIDGCWLALGVFQFGADKIASVEISNKDTDGHVIADAVQWLKK